MKSKALWLSLVLVFLAILAAGGGIFYHETVLKERQALQALALAEGLQDQGDLEKACQQYETAYQKFGRTDSGAEILFKASLCRKALGNLEASLAGFQKLLDEHSESGRVPDALAEMGSCAEGMGQEQTATEWYTRLRTEFPESPRVGDAMAALGSFMVGQADVEKAQPLLQEVVQRFPNSSASRRAMEALGKANLQILFSARPQEGTVRYDVQKGESLVSIANKFKTTPDLIKFCNGLTRDWLRPGQTLKIVTDPFTLQVDLSDRELILSLGSRLFKRYSVGVGKYDSTPVGDFKIVDKVVNPTWYPPEGGSYLPGDPKNLLGTRWMAIDRPGYGIHGTTEPDTIGQALSAGCVRMLNQDVEELYALVPVGTTVKIVQ